MITMSMITMISSETALWESQHASFLTDVFSITTMLESQTTISHEWLARMERDGEYIISIRIQGTPIFYEQLVHTEQRQNIIESAMEQAEPLLFLHSHHMLVTQYVNFSMTVDGARYFVAHANIPRELGDKQVLIIHSLQYPEQQVFHQRIIVILLNVAGILLLAVFSYFFTKRMIEPLKKSRQQQVDFVAAASHELRTPLAVIQSNTSAMNYADEPEFKRFQSSILSESNRMSRLIGDLLTLASADHDKFQVRMESIELDTLLLEIYDKFDVLVREAGLELSIVLPDGKSPKIKGDFARLTQVFVILIDNAIQHTTRGGKISLQLHNYRRKVKIRVADTGSGIPVESRDQIWERFYQADKSRKSSGNYGLGLPIAKEIVQLHRGKIEVFDNEPLGTVFEVTLPIIE